MVDMKDVKEMVEDAIVSKLNATKMEIADMKAEMDKPITVNITELPKVRMG